MALRAREAGIDLVCRMPADLPDIVADKRAVKQILINLLSNAIKFTQRGGKVSVTGEADGGHVTFTVEDTGVGIGEDDLRHVGDPFFQVRTAYDRPHDGTGLGLSIVKGLVELHGGELDDPQPRRLRHQRLGAPADRLREERASSKRRRMCERLPVPEPAVVPTDIRVRKRA